jgi:hypothetical protein
VRSLKTFDRIRGPFNKRTAYIFVSYNGRLSYVFVDAGVLKWKGSKLDSGPIMPKNWTEADLEGGGVNWYDTDVIWPVRARFGFSWIRNAPYCNIPNAEIGWHPNGLSGRSWCANVSGLIVPHWFGVIVLGIIAALSWTTRSSRFSLRTLLIATTLVAVGLGLIVWVP